MGNRYCCANVQNSQYHQTLSGCRVQGRKYFDNEFQPTKHSLINDWQQVEASDLVEEWSRFDWARASEIQELKDHDGKM